MSSTYKRFLELIPNSGKILDLGCGSGRDSLNFMKLGYEIVAVDGSRELAKKASILLGQEVINCRFEELQIEEVFDGIWACASLLHLNKEELRTLLNKLYNNLREAGIIYMSFKYGDSEYIDDKGRYFNGFTSESITKFINENTEFTIMDTYITEDKLGRVKEVKWLNIICKRN